MPIASNPVNSGSALSVARALKIGLGVFVLFLILMFPARVAWNLAPPSENAQLAGIEGSIWQGRAQSLVLQGVDLGSLSWHWRPTGLLMGRWSYRVELSGAGSEANGDVGVGINGDLIVSDMIGKAPIASTVAAFIRQRIPLPVVIDGDLIVDLDELRLGNQMLLELAGRLTATDLAVGGHRLGQLDADLMDENRGLLAAIFSEGDPSPVIEGEALLLPGGSYRIDVVVADPQRLGSDIDTFVRGVGVPEQEGKWRIRWQGQL